MRAWTRRRAPYIGMAAALFAAFAVAAGGGPVWAVLIIGWGLLLPVALTRGISKRGHVRATHSVPDEPSESTPIHPRDEQDRFCTCLDCGLAGNHHVEIVAVNPRDRVKEIVAEMRLIAELEHPSQGDTARFRKLKRELGIQQDVVAGPGFRRMIHPNLPDQPIKVPADAVPGHEASGWQLAPGERWTARRTCVFCEHVWYTAAIGPQEEK